MMKTFCWLLGALCLGGIIDVQGQSLSDSLRHADWRLFWTNEFNVTGDSSTVADRWQFAYPWGRNLGGFEAQYYTGQQVSADSAGVLHLMAKRRTTPRRYQVGNGPVRRLDYESGMLFSLFKQDSMTLSGCSPERTGFTYGLFEIRCRLPRKLNSFSAFWLYGDPDEVDVFEAGPPDGISNNVVLWSHVFWRLGPLNASNEASQSFFYWSGPGHLVDEFHVYAVSWQSHELVYYFDGIPIRRETRLLPIGCPLDVIANLGMSTYAQVREESFDIDYIRVYKSRRAWPRSPIIPIAPAVGILQGPHSTAGVLGATVAELRWRLRKQSAQRPRLVLQTNSNPRDFNTLALPFKGRWVTPLTTFNEADSPRHWIASPDNGRSPLNWTLYDLCGQVVRSGQLLPALGWELRWPDLSPGAYCLLLNLGNQLVIQPVYQLGRVTSSEFAPGWVTPPLPATSE